MIRLTVAGAAGRMGRCVLELAARDPRFEITAALVAGEKLRADCDALVDFTDSAGTMQWLEACETRRVPMVIGATGHDEVQLARIAQVARSIPIVKAANFSVGMQVVLNVLGRIVTELGDEYDIEIVETHHRHKIDAPSGTAQVIVAELQRVRDQSRPPQADEGADNPVLSPLVGGATVVFGRHGKVGER
ncbi:MAG: dihydrodipicolinate reductase C-terminal domain-containing protein, partial [Planctomycetota bacterium]